MRATISICLLSMVAVGCAESGEPKGDAATSPDANGVQNVVATASSDAAPDVSQGVDSATENDSAVSDAAGSPPDTADTADDPADGAAAQPEPGEVIAIEPGGDTICSRGTPFRFFAIGGTSNKLIIDFGGGGACWNQTTCSVAQAIFNEEAPTLEMVNAAFSLGLLSGIYELDNPESPFAGWNLVHIPYCTGDIHWGDAVQDYGNDLVIHHKGLINSRATLDWIYEHFPAPEAIFVTGCSAGAYGAILHSAAVAEHYPDTPISVLGDSGCGIITETFFEDSFPKWNAVAALPEWAREKPIEEMTIVDVYADVANHFPEHRFTHYTAAYDSNQEFYYTAMGGEEADWSPKALGVLHDIRERAENFRYYIAPGAVHCITPYEILFTRESAGVSFVNWIRDVVEADEPPDDVECEGDACHDDPVCAACAAAESEGTAGPYCGFCD